jgi:hypothetical protein
MSRAIISLPSFPATYVTDHPPLYVPNPLAPGKNAEMGPVTRRRNPLGRGRLTAHLWRDLTARRSRRRKSLREISALWIPSTDCPVLGASDSRLLCLPSRRRLRNAVAGENTGCPIYSLVCLGEAQRDGVHAIAEARGTRAIVEDVA